MKLARPLALTFNWDLEAWMAQTHLHRVCTCVVLFRRMGPGKNSLETFSHACVRCTLALFPFYTLEDLYLFF